MDRQVNGGSPVGPGYVVFERAPGLRGYDLALAKASVGPGWHGLLEALWKVLDRVENKSAYVVQVKEKFGALTVYPAEGDRYLSGIIGGLELASTVMCEECGAPGTLRTDRTWHTTRCDVHAPVRKQVEPTS